MKLATEITVMLQKTTALFSEIEKPTHFLFLCEQKEQIVLFLQKNSQKIMFHMKQ